MPIERLGRDSGGEISRLLRLGRFLILLFSTMAMVWGAPAHARKVALIIANSSYVSENVLSLRNPIYDADLVARSSEQAGFEVTVMKNVGRIEMLSALSDFRATASGADVAMIYYAGHGIEVDARQYLLPIDANPRDEFWLPEVAIEIGKFVEVLRDARNGVLILDACRDSGITTAWQSRSRSIAVGFGSIPQEPNMLVMTSAGPGQRAQDGPVRESSPFARSFAKWLPEPGLALVNLAIKVTSEVSSETEKAQVPAFSSRLGEEIVLVPRQIAADPEQEVYDWDAAMRLNTVAGFQDFIRKYPGSDRKSRVGYYLYELGGVAALNPVQDILERDRIVLNDPAGQGGQLAAPLPSSGPAAPGPIQTDYVSPEPSPTLSEPDYSAQTVDAAPVFAGTEANLAVPDSAPVAAVLQASEALAAAGPPPAPIDPQPLVASPPAARVIEDPVPELAKPRPHSNDGGQFAAADTRPASEGLAAAGPSPTPKNPQPVVAPPAAHVNPEPVKALAVPRPRSDDGGQFAATTVKPTAGPLPRPSSIPATAPGSGQCLLTADQIQFELNNGRSACGILPGTVAPAKDLRPLPEFPPAPRFSNADYPNCRDDFQTAVGNLAKLDIITACWKRLNDYAEFDMIAFVNALIAHQNAVSRLYQETLGPDARLYYTPDSQREFSDRMKAVHGASNPGGANRIDYEATQRRLDADRKYVEEQYNRYLAAPN